MQAVDFCVWTSNVVQLQNASNFSVSVDCSDFCASSRLTLTKVSWVLNIQCCPVADRFKFLCLHRLQWFLCFQPIDFDQGFIGPKHQMLSSRRTFPISQTLIRQLCISKKKVHSRGILELPTFLHITCLFYHCSTTVDVSTLVFIGFPGPLQIRLFRSLMFRLRLRQDKCHRPMRLIATVGMSGRTGLPTMF